jgi:hypothetical protein
MRCLYCNQLLAHSLVSPRFSSSRTELTSPAFELAFSDCHMLFRALCKLSNVDLPEGCVIIVRTVTRAARPP